MALINKAARKRILQILAIVFIFAMVFGGLIGTLLSF